MAGKVRRKRRHGFTPSSGRSSAPHTEMSFPGKGGDGRKRAHDSLLGGVGKRETYKSAVGAEVSHGRGHKALDNWTEEHIWVTKGFRERVP